MAEFVTATVPRPVQFLDQRLPARFWAKVFPLEDGCWVWAGNANKFGYGKFSKTHGHTVATHRHCYETLVAPVSVGLQCDHLCRRRACCNPAHIDVVTPRENILRGQTIPAENAAKTHCKHGHEFTELNTYYEGDRGRRCRKCRSRRSIEYKGRQRWISL